MGRWINQTMITDKNPPMIELWIYLLLTLLVRKFKIELTSN